MISKRILTPDEVGALVPHYPELDKAKIQRIADRKKRIIRLHGEGNPQEGEGLNVQPIVVCPSELFPGRDYILNGKHRAAVAYFRGWSLMQVRLTSRNAIRHHLSEEWLGLGREALENAFDGRYTYELLCRSHGITSMKDLVEASREMLTEVLSNGAV